MERSIFWACLLMLLVVGSTGYVVYRNRWQLRQRIRQAFGHHGLLAPWVLALEFLNWFVETAHSGVVTVLNLATLLLLGGVVLYGIWQVVLWIVFTW